MVDTITEYDFEKVGTKLDVGLEITHIYHYTNNQALIGMLGENELWVSRCDFLNDAQEVKYFTNVLVQVINIIESDIEKLRLQGDTDGDILRFLISKLKLTQFNFEEKFQEIIDRSFVFSMSANEDSHLLFSNYSKGNGYNIGFRKDEFIKSLYQDNMAVHAALVNYDPEEQVGMLLNEFFGRYNQLIYTLASTPQRAKITDYYVDKLYNALTLSFFTYALNFKHPKFASEEEFRIIIFEMEPDINTKFRTMGESIIPFVKVKPNTSKFPVDYVTIGPKNNLDIAEAGMRVFLNYNSYSDVIIQKSVIPLRY
ncbi:DUF2971 domain-containing protein [Paenibacillus sp. D51F]